MNIDLKNQVALVTGGTRGIGAAISNYLAESGASVAVNFSRDEKTASVFIKKMRRKRLPCFLLPGDVSDFHEAESLVHRVIERLGRIDILVNNAGIWEPNPLDNPRAEEAWDRTLRTNLKSAFNMCSHVTPHMSRGRGGRIINISSTAGIRGEARFSHYAASKGGMIAFTKSLAVELASQQILVNCVAPGWIWTDMTVPYLTKKRNRKAVLSQIPLGKIGEPEDVAGAVLFLCSKFSSHITGETVNVNGGSVLGG